MTKKTLLVILIIVVICVAYFAWRHSRPVPSNSAALDSIKAAQIDSANLKKQSLGSPRKIGADSAALTTTMTGILFGRDQRTGCMGRGVCTCSDGPPVIGMAIPATMTYNDPILSISFSQGDLERIQPQHKNDFDGATYTFESEWQLGTLVEKLGLPVPAVSAGIAYEIDNSNPGMHVLNIPLR